MHYHVINICSSNGKIHISKNAQSEVKSSHPAIYLEHIVIKIISEYVLCSLVDNKELELFG